MKPPLVTAFKCPKCEAEILNETADGAVVMAPPKCSFGHPATEMEQVYLEAPQGSGLGGNGG